MFVPPDSSLGQHGDPRAGGAVDCLEPSAGLEQPVAVQGKVLPLRQWVAHFAEAFDPPAHEIVRAALEGFPVSGNLLDALVEAVVIELVATAAGGGERRSQGFPSLEPFRWETDPSFDPGGGPGEIDELRRLAERAGWVCDGPHPAAGQGCCWRFDKGAIHLELSAMNDGRSWALSLKRSPRLLDHLWNAALARAPMDAHGALSRAARAALGGKLECMENDFEDGGQKLEAACLQTLFRWGVAAAEAGGVPDVVFDKLALRVRMRAPSAWSPEAARYARLLPQERRSALVRQLIGSPTDPNGALHRARYVFADPTPESWQRALEVAGVEPVPSANPVARKAFVAHWQRLGAPAVPTLEQKASDLRSRDRLPYVEALARLGAGDALKKLTDNPSPAGAAAAGEALGLQKSRERKAPRKKARAVPAAVKKPKAARKPGAPRKPK